MEVLIVSKTHMQHCACIGVLVMATNQNIRLLNDRNQYPAINTEYEIGDIWDIEFKPSNRLIPPHVEDVIVGTKRLISKNNPINKIIKERNLINWNGDIHQLFDGLLHWTKGGTGYIPVNSKLPKQSVDFWQPEHKLIKSFDYKAKYLYTQIQMVRKISFVGYQQAVPTVHPETIIRVSLSRTFPRDSMESGAAQGFYLQLSGWYEN